MSRAVALLAVALAAFCVAGCAAAASPIRLPSSPPHDPISAVEALLNRWFPRSVVGDLLLDTCNPEPDGRDAFELDYDGPVVVVRGSSATALASAVMHYLETYCHVTLSWNGDTLQNLPAVLPSPRRVRVVKNTPWSYYMNVCTVSYTAVWWDWPRWEREIDWMALNGINLPLAFTGQEYVWQKTFAALGVSGSELATDFLSGPAFMAWQRMGNLQGWGGPLPQAFIDAQYSLQLQILARMRQLGMTPVLPAFAGHVPRALTKLFPGANITQSPNWNGMNATYCCDDLLQATDPLYLQIGKAFIEQQTAVYGTGHIYQADSFNEMLPPSSEPSYLAAASAAVYESMAAADPQAVWLMQGWLFVNNPDFWGPAQVRAYLSGVPNSAMIILDLYSEFNPQYQKFDQYYGKPYIYCELHNFGGNLGLYGMIPSMSASIPAAINAPNSTCIGLGLTMEGTLQNYVVYDYALKQNWNGWGSADAPSFVNEYVYRRYGSQDTHALAAWQQLLTTVYSSTRGGGVTKSMIELRPGLSIDRSGFMPTALFYDPTDLARAWSTLLSAAQAPVYNTSTYRYDLVDVTRQVLSDYFLDLQHNLTHAYLWDTGSIQRVGAQMLDVITDLDGVLATDSHFLFGAWIAAARAMGSASDGSADLYEFNARNQVTLWGPVGEIDDYASKSWSGLLSSYYYTRWSLYITALQEAVSAGTPFSQSQFDAAVLQWSQDWQTQHQHFPTHTSGDTIDVVRAAYAKYCPIRLGAAACTALGPDIAFA